MKLASEMRWESFVLSKVKKNGGGGEGSGSVALLFTPVDASVAMEIQLPWTANEALKPEQLNSE